MLPVSYCCVTDYPTTQCLQTTVLVSAGQEFGSGFAGGVGSDLGSLLKFWPRWKNLLATAPCRKEEKSHYSPNSLFSIDLTKSHNCVKEKRRCRQAFVSFGRESLEKVA